MSKPGEGRVDTQTAGERAAAVRDMVTPTLERLGLASDEGAAIEFDVTEHGLRFQNIILVQGETKDGVTSPNTVVARSFPKKIALQSPVITGGEGYRHVQIAELNSREGGNVLYIVDTVVAGEEDNGTEIGEKTFYLDLPPDGDTPNFDYIFNTLEVLINGLSAANIVEPGGKAES